jgi:hypothetical protein
VLWPTGLSPEMALMSALLQRQLAAIPLPPARLAS